MRLGLLDWSMVAGLVLVLVVAALWARRYSRSVAGFLSAERHYIMQFVMEALKLWSLSYKKC